LLLLLLAVSCCTVLHYFIAVSCYALFGASQLLAVGCSLLVHWLLAVVLAVIVGWLLAVVIVICC
jgi:hypothetical protein